MNTRFTLPLLIALVFGLSGCSKDEAGPSELDQRLESALLEASATNSLDFFRLPDETDLFSIPQDPKNPLSLDKIELGKMLFHESALAVDPKLVGGMETFSCASCHHAKGGFQACLKQGLGEGGNGFGMTGEGRSPSAAYPLDSLDLQPIRTPSAMNTAYQSVTLWNGQFGATGLNAGTEASWTPGTPKAVNSLGYEGVEIQAIAGMSVHRLNIDTTKLFSYPRYRSLFDNVFGDKPKEERYTKETVGLSIAAFERSILSNEAPFQEWLDGDVSAMNDEEKEGALLFFGKAQCNSCHTGPALNSMAFYALGMNDLEGPGIYGTDTKDADGAKKGRGGFTGRAEDMFKFKVPQLYNLKDSPFYGHGGNFTNLRSLIEYKNNGVAENTDVPASQIAADFKPLGLTDIEIDYLVKFLESALRDPDLMRYTPSSLPSGMCFPNNDKQSKSDMGC